MENTKKQEGARQSSPIQDKKEQSYTEEYIRMLFQAREIQKLYACRPWDIVAIREKDQDKKPWVITPLIPEMKQEIDATLKNNDGINEFIWGGGRYLITWVPRIEDLMIIARAFLNWTWVNTCKVCVESAFLMQADQQRRSPGPVRFDLQMEQVVIAVLMRDKFRKRWNGSKWKKILGIKNPLTGKEI